MRHTFSWVAFAIIASALAFIALPALGQVADAEPMIATSSIWYDVWTILQPVVVLLVSTVGPVLVTWLAARLLALMKISDEKQRLAIEAQLREALHQSAANALKYALTKVGMPAGGAIGGAVLAEALRYVEEKNPDALARLDVHTDALRDIILSKAPDIAMRHMNSGG